MTIKRKVAQLSLLVALFVGAVAALPASDNTRLNSIGIGAATLGECAGSGGTCT